MTTTVPEKKEDRPREVQSDVLGVDQILTGKSLPFREVEIPERPLPDGRPGKMLVQALRTSDMDEVNEAHRKLFAEDEPVATGHRWNALIVAKAMRKPDKTLAAGAHWMAFAERLSNELLPGTLQAAAQEILTASGFGPMAKALQKKSSSPTSTDSTS